jgi:hypothetical protein
MGLKRSRQIPGQIESFATLSSFNLNLDPDSIGPIIDSEKKFTHFIAPCTACSDDVYDTLPNPDWNAACDSRVEPGRRVPWAGYDSFFSRRSFVSYETLAYLNVLLRRSMSIVPTSL